MNSAFYFIKKQLKQLIERVLPAQCLLCGLPSHNKLICPYCQKEMLQARVCCQYCGLSLTNSQLFCGDCVKQKHLFTKLHALASYQPPYPTLIKQLKYEHKLISGELLGQLLADSIASHFSGDQITGFDYLIAVPLHSKKLRQRGFNQAQLIADIVSRQLKIPLLANSVKRNKETQAQEGLSISKRRKNLRAAFTANKNSPLQGKHIALLDDVVTTGATIDSLCHCLLAEKVSSITVFCICRTDPHHHL
ncbi:MAG: ComF family protein [Psychromonas sp.]|uniref:ComF family protein n=1 Tax=Psychromonas sp. TaxID=1884585 RepID=UPI0039E58AE2